MAAAMTNDLNKINTALKLGDRFIPPLGSVVIVEHRGNHHTAGYLVESRITVDQIVTFGSDCFLVETDWVLGCANFYNIVDPKSSNASRLLEVCSLRGPSPPFESWKRY